MQEVRRLMEKGKEEALEDMILEQVRKNHMTISNLREITYRVIEYLESNATLEMETGDPVITEPPIHEINKSDTDTDRRPGQSSTSDQHQKP